MAPLFAGMKESHWERRVVYLTRAALQLLLTSSETGARICAISTKRFAALALPLRATDASDTIVCLRDQKELSNRPEIRHAAVLLKYS